MNEQVRDALVALGAMAEMCHEFTRQLVLQGYSRKEAMELTKTYLTAITTPQHKEDN